MFCSNLQQQPYAFCLGRICFVDQNFQRARLESGLSGALVPSLAPPIERMFRYTWFLATEKRDAMVREGREDEVDALVAEARALHDKLRRGATD